MKTSLALTLFVSLSAAALAQQPAKPGTPAPKTPPPALSNPGPAPDASASVSPDTVVVTVGDYKLTRAQFEALLSQLNDQARANKRAVAQQLGDVEAMAVEARKRKIDQQPGIKELMRVQEDNVLANTLGKEIQNTVKPTDAEEKAYYDAHKDQFEEAKARHILIRFQGSRVPVREGGKDLSAQEALAKAEDIRKKLIAGGDFAALAKADSDDTGSGAQGGELGTFSRGQMVPEFEKAVFTLPINQVSEPIRTDFGYHIIQVESRTAKTFDQAKPEIEKKVAPQMVKTAADKLREQTPVVLNDTYFGK